jgi:hypothetical protein
MGMMYVLMQQQMDMHVFARDAHKDVESKQLFHCLHDIMSCSNL